MTTFDFIPLLGLFMKLENLFFLANGNSVFFLKYFSYVISCLKIYYFASGYLF